MKKRTLKLIILNFSGVGLAAIGIWIMDEFLTPILIIGSFLPFILSIKYIPGSTYGEAKVGAHCRILGQIDRANSHLVNIGDYTILGTGSCLITHCPIDPGGIDIGKNVFIGMNSLILPNIKVGEGTIIGAGSVVTKDVPPFEIWAGNPAKKIGIRSQENVDYQVDMINAGLEIGSLREFEAYYKRRYNDAHGRFS